LYNQVYILRLQCALQCRRQPSVTALSGHCDDRKLRGLLALRRRRCPLGSGVLG
jgi:hypothetical protein